MATPQTHSGSTKTPRIIENNKYKLRKDVLDTSQDVIPTSSVLPAFQDRILHFKVNFVAPNKKINMLDTGRQSRREMHKSLFDEASSKTIYTRPKQK